MTEGARSEHSFGRVAELVDRLGRAAHCLQFTAGLNPAQWEALRYLARANRYSRSPTALAEYLGTTKGTVSQTVRALEAKGYVSRRRGAVDRRSVVLAVTAEGARLLEQDPIVRLEFAAAGLPPSMGDAVAHGLSFMLAELQHGCGLRSFGACEQCGHFRDGAAADEPDGPHRCGLTSEPLDELDTTLLCINFMDPR